jgi:hypothetical protein
MKTAGFVFRMIACAVLMCGTSSAAPSGPASQQGSSANSASDSPHSGHAAPAHDAKHETGKQHSDQPRGVRRASDKNHPPSRKSQAANRSNQVPIRQGHSASGNAMNLHEPGADKSAGAAKGGLVQNETVNSALRVRPPSTVRPTAPSLDNVRHRSPNSAVVGGSENATTRNTGAINGTRMNRKP